MLMTDNRQLFLIDTNTSHNTTTNVKVNMLHHPITIFSGKKESVSQILACRNGLMTSVNLYESSSWFLPFKSRPLDIERFVLLAYTRQLSVLYIVFP